MRRFVFREPGAERVRIFRAGGLVVPRGMLAVAKASFAERAANRRARERIVAPFERELADVLVSFRKGIDIGQAEAAVVSGDVRILFNAAAPNQLEAQLAATMGPHLEEALESGAQIGLRFATPALEGVSPGMATEAAVAYIERQGVTAVLGITQNTQAGIREVLTLGLRDRLAPVEVAQRIGNLAGLTPRQVIAVENFRAHAIRRLAPIPEALTPQVQRVIDQQVNRYRDRQLLLRGRSIAETETQNAIAQGERAFWDRGIADGAVDAETVFKTWRTVFDDRVCPICFPLHGQTIPFNELFLTSEGGVTGPTVHPRCRCYLEFSEGREPSGQRDRGEAAVTDQENRRYLDRATMEDDLHRAGEQRSRAERRLATLPPGSRAATRAQTAVRGFSSTEDTLRRRLLELEETGFVRDVAGFQRPPVGSRVRNLRARKIPKGEIGEVLGYSPNLYGDAYDRVQIRRPDGTIATISEHSVELVEGPVRVGPTTGGREPRGR